MQIAPDEEAVAPTPDSSLDGHPRLVQQVAGLVRDQNRSAVEFTSLLQPRSSVAKGWLPNSSPGYPGKPFARNRH